MAELQDGERIEVRGSTSTYTLERRGGTYSCTCPSWRNQSTPIGNRTCKHLRAFLGEATERARTGSAAAALPRLTRPAWVPKVHEDREERARRRAAVANALEIFPVAYDKMMLAYGLRMPRHLAYAVGFWQALTDAEREEAWAYIGTGLCGVTDFFEQGGLERQVQPGLDERLHYRYRRDPPEMVSIFGGNSDGSHWGLWYDDPAELPRAICHNWARDSAETSTEEPTLLGTFRASLYGEHSEPLDAEFRHAGVILDWLDEVHLQELAAHREEAIAPLPARAACVGGEGPWIPRWKPPADLPDQWQRYERYRERAPIVDEWIARARAALPGEPGLALLIGRDLHWMDADEYRHACTELLVAGYRALGRDAIAEIVRVHHQHRDLATVDIYSERVQSPFEQALNTGDVAAMTALLRDSDDPTKLVESIAYARGEMLALLLPHASDQVVDDAQLFHLSQLEFWRVREGQPDYAEHREPHREMLRVLCERRAVSGRVLMQALTSTDPSIVALAAAYADLGWRSDRGRSALHLLCRSAHVDGVRMLLERGADAKLVDRDGETPYTAANHAWIEHRREVEAIKELLRAHGGAPPAPAAAPPPEGTWAVGARVTHAKFGEGTIKTATGKGPDAKLVIEFPSGTKTLLGKFVVR